MTMTGAEEAIWAGVIVLSIALLLLSAVLSL